jgi:hypothetical protein
MEVFTPLTFLMQLASFFFTMSGIHAVLLVIRFFLVMSALCSFGCSVLGSPLWPKCKGIGGIFADDSLVWSIINLYVHGSSLICLILDERQVSLTDDEIPCGACFIGLRSFCETFKMIVAPYLEIVEFEEEKIFRRKTFFTLCTRGVSLSKCTKRRQIKVERKTLSGEMFDLKYLRHVQ